MTEQEKQQYASLGYHFQDVYSIFEHHFGEENVDIWDLPNTEHYNSSIKVSIVVHFPVLTVTNESGRYVTIQDLYVKTQVDALGKMYGQFTCIRATFSYKQFMSGYIHSHIPRGVSTSWKQSCLGSGPIRTTIARLSTENNELTWMMYCRELHEYVQVESLQGGPYIRMESIGGANKAYYRVFEDINNDNSEGDENFSYVIHENCKAIYKEFLQYLLKKKPFKFTYHHGRYWLAYSSLEFGFMLTEHLINFLKEKHYSAKPFLDRKYIEEYILKPDGIYKTDTVNSNSSMAALQGTHLFDFKGTPIYLHIEEPNANDENSNTVYIIYQYLAKDIAVLVQNIVNYYYEKELNQGVKLV